MQVETLRDVLHWTRRFHDQLQECTKHCASRNQGERAKLLLDYLSEHEGKLVKVLDGFEHIAKVNVLDTWCYEYVDRNVIQRHEECNAPFEKLDTGELIREIINIHDQVIDLYEHLLHRVSSTSAQELLEELKTVEQNASMQMARDFGRLEDI